MSISIRESLGQCLSLIPRNERHKISLLVLAQLLLAFLDLVGVALFGILAVISISGIKSSAPGDRTSRVLELLNLSNFSLETQASILAISALVLLTLKTTLTYLLSRKILHFLSLRSASASSALLKRVLSAKLLMEQKKTQQEILYSITGGVNLIVIGVIGSLATLVADVFSLLILGIGLFLYSPYVTLCAMAYFFILGWINYRALHLQIVEQSRISTNLSIQSNETTLELLGAYRELHLSGNEETYLDRFSAERVGIAGASAKLAVFPNVAKYVIEVGMLAGIIFLAAIQFVTNDAVRAIGAISIFLAASTRIAPALLRIQQGIFSIKGNLSSSIQSLDLIMDLQKDEPQRVKPSSRSSGSSNCPMIEFENVSFKYKDESKFAISKLSFSVNRGQKVAIVGPSGAGKSTVLDLLLSLSTPDDGLICINGISTQDFIESNPGFIGFVPQVTRIVNDSLVRNIALGVKPEVIDLARVSELVQALDLTDIQDVKTSTARLGDDGGRLSGGQRQRIGIARALYSRPQILVLDEATSALDSISENKFSDFLESISSQITVLTVAHRLSTVKNSDVVLYLENGNLLGKGDFEEVRRKIPNFDEQARLMGL